jgi:hypothetical protein
MGSKQPVLMPGGRNRYIYPRTKEEIRQAIKSIKARPRPDSKTKKLARDLDGALEQLNIYRYLSSAPCDVALDEGYCRVSDDAAEACRNAGRIAHDLGSGTADCNLHQGQGSRAQMVDGLIEDLGEKNRDRRGDRRWCLNWKPEKTGFGLVGDYAAMHCIDNSGAAPEQAWSYPGPGYFPAEWLKGDAWSLYLPDKAPPAPEVQVSIWKLVKSPEAMPSMTDTPKGRKLLVPFVKTYENAINFGPETHGAKGAYFVRVEGPGLAEQYIVELY